MGPLVEPGSPGEQAGRLFLAALVVVMLPSLPFGNFVIYPFMILTTWFHEMGHGLTALALGQEFDRLLIFANGSGLAESRVSVNASPLVRAGIAAGGPLAPSAVGALLILASAHQRLWRPALALMAAAIVVSVAIWVRSGVGVVVMGLVAAVLGLVATRASDALSRFVLQFVGVLGALSALRDFDYLFAGRAVIDGREVLSDTGQIAAALGLPHWLWAGLILLISGLMVGAALKFALADTRRLKGPLPANVLQFKRPER